MSGASSFVPTANFNPRAPYGARRRAVSVDNRRVQISIHAPHTGRDLLAIVATLCANLISIHAPHTGRDCTLLLSCSGNPAFQSTRPIRGATPLVSSSAYLLRNFNPRAPYGARRPGTAVPATPGNFNPRAPYGARRHRTCRRTQPRNFNPRAPYGARLMGCVSSAAASHFNPRAPYGARRPAGHCISRHDGISIHAPHTGRDS